MKGMFHDRASLRRSADRLWGLAEIHGISDLTVIKERRDSKLIAKGRHPEWGKVALKVVDPIASPGQAFSDLHIDTIVAREDSSIFPQIRSFDLGYSIVQWIDADDVGIAAAGSLSKFPIVEFAEAIREWGSGTSKGERLSVHEIRSIVRFYVQVTIRRMLYRSASRCVSSCARFILQRAELVGHIECMASSAHTLELERTMMLSDLHIENVLYDRPLGRLVVVDFEAMRPGSYVFDVVFYLSFLIIKGAPREVTDRLARHVFGSEYMSSDSSVLFFRSFAAYMISTFMIIDGHASESIRDSLNIIDTTTA